ncbi:N-acetyl-D-glucosamine kinase-like [Pollicipes pollicipes]|uniref:N-acetyl-D-glucosamine kinase-like n=1 Tax=Pollicipes pollicipes TaxID=41117 RepID=UPI0018856229|nr:N-acetyl-D-glucosamine kinase-like [Pollicipes pollicipes]
MASSSTYFVGIEGGGSHSVAHVLDGGGALVGTTHGPGTNLYLEGLDETIGRFRQLVHDALRDAGVPTDTRLRGLGISSSGCEAEETVRELRGRLMALHPGLTDCCVVCSDTAGIMATALDGGGVCLISGTGSNSLLLNPDGSVHRCGGWSYMLGEKASAWWIAYRAIKALIEEEDHVRTPPHSSDTMRRCIFDYFEISDRFGLLEHAYTSFSKAHFAGLCRHLAGAAKAGDPLCRQLFADAGRWLGRFIVALLPRAAPALLRQPGGLRIVAVGGVFNSWPLMRQAFVDEVTPHQSSFTLLQLTGSLALGAAYLAAKEARFDLPKDLSKNSSLLCQRGQ